MDTFSEAIAYGAATIINAISIGKGAAFGVNLWTRACVHLRDTPQKIEGIIRSDPREDTTLLRECVLTVLKHYKLDNRFGAIVETESNIPIARGLKSSSVASNAVVLATLGALGKPVSDYTAINLGVDAAIQAKKTITGAFDDACASFFGNIVVTNNITREVLKTSTIRKDYAVIFFVPKVKAYTITSNLDRMKAIAPLVETAFQEAVNSKYWTALTLNGILHCAALGFDPKPCIDALEAGAIASGLSGTGPAIVAVVEQELSTQVEQAWAPYQTNIIQGKINRQKAKILRKE